MKSKNFSPKFVIDASIGIGPYLVSLTVFTRASPLSAKDLNTCKKIRVDLIAWILTSELANEMIDI